MAFKIYSNVRFCINRFCSHIFFLFCHTIRMKKKTQTKNCNYKICIIDCAFLFFFASFLGFIWEAGIFFIRDGCFYKRGFFYGPLLPVYGVGGLLMILFLHPLKKKPVFCFFLSSLIGFAVEFIVGWYLEYFWNLRYWDYSSFYLNLYGYVCFLSILGFALAGTVWVCFFADLLIHLSSKLPIRIRILIISVLAITFLLDIMASLLLPNTGEGITL